MGRLVGGWLVTAPAAVLIAVVCGLFAAVGFENWYSRYMTEYIYSKEYNLLHIQYNCKELNMLFCKLFFITCNHKIVDS